MQSLDIISVNLWQILISLCNLLILFLVIKKFLFAPVKKALDKRKEEIDSHYSAAESAESDAIKSKLEWEKRVSDADSEASEIIKNASISAEKKKAKIISEADAKASEIVSRAEEQARLEREKAGEQMKQEIIDISAALSEKLLEREINMDDHKKLIDSFINDLGELDE